MNSRKHVLASVFALSVGLAMILSACGASSSAEPTGQLAEIGFAQVEVGLGSPTPVSVTIDVNYPTTCTQFSQISQNLEKDGTHTRIKIEVRIMDMEGICVEQPSSFRMIFPINASGLSKGTYSVEVNGIDAGNFEFQN